MPGWKKVPGEKYTWEKGNNRITIQPENFGEPRGSKTLWLEEKSRIGGKRVRFGYAKTYPEAEKIAKTFMKKW